MSSPRSEEVRVAVFTDNDFDRVGAVTTTLSALLEHAPAGVRTRIYTASEFSADHPEYLSIRSPGMSVPFRGSSAVHLPPLRRFLAHARRDGINVVHLTTPGPVGLAAVYVAGRLGLPLVGSLHSQLTAGIDELRVSAGMRWMIQRGLAWPYGRCERVFVPSDAPRRMLLAAGIDGQRMGVWSSGVDTRVFSPAGRSQVLREAWGVSDRCPAVVFVGRISAENGVGRLPAISDRLRQMGLQHRLVIVGDGPLLPALRRQVPDAIVTGMLSRGDVARACASADIFVSASRADSAGTAVLEAQASGLPVVVADTGGSHEHMVDGDTGVTCAGEHPERWASVIADVLAVRVRREAMGRAALVYAATRHWRLVLAPVYEAYGEAVRVGRGRARSTPDLAPSLTGRL